MYIDSELEEQQLINFIAFLIVIGICVISHEGGHYLAAKWRNVLVHEFSFGMGPSVFHKQKGETLWSFRAFPIGGFVKLDGEDGETNEYDRPDNYDHSRALNNKKPWERLLIILAGATVNLLLAWLITASYLTGHGVYTFDSPVIGSVIIDKPAYVANLKQGDTIKSINGNELKKWADIKTTVQDKDVKDNKFSIIIVRDGKEKEITTFIPFDKEHNGRLLGVQPPFVKYPFYKSLTLAWGYSWSMGVAIIKGLYNMITGKIVADVVGPVGIAVIAGDAIKQGFWAFIVFLGVINLNLGLLNLLPFPALDGGRAVFIIVEMITKKKMPEKYEAWVHYAGFIILLTLIVLVTAKDLFKFFK